MLQKNNNSASPEDPLSLAEACELIHEVRKLFKQGAIQEVITLSDKIIPIIEAHQSWENLALIYDINAFAYWSKGLTVLALKKLNYSIEQILPKCNTPTNKHAVNTYISHGYFNLQLLKYDIALNSLKKALAINLQLNGDKNSICVAIYNQLGSLHRNMGYFEESLNYYKKSGAILAEIAPPNSLNKSHLYMQIGNLHNEKKEFSIALNYYLQAISIRESQSIPLVDLAPSYSNIGNMYKIINQPEIAKKYLCKALQIYKQSELLQTHHTCFIYATLGEVYVQLKKLNKAKHYLLKAENLIQKNKNTNIGFAYTSTYLSFAKYYTQKKQYRKAIKKLNIAINFEQNMLGESHPLLTKNYRIIAEAYELTENKQSALQYYQKALFTNTQEALTNTNDTFPNPSKLKAHNPIAFFITLRKKAKVLLQLHQETNTPSNQAITLTTIYETIQLANQVLEANNHFFIYHQNEEEISKELIAFYDSAITICYLLFEKTQQISYIEQAFIFIEKSKAMNLLFTIKNEKFLQTTTEQKDLINQEKQIVKEISLYQQKLFEAEFQKKEKNITYFTNKLNDLQVQQHQLNINLEDVFPAYVKHQQTNTVIGLTQLQQHLKKDQLVLNYFVGKQHLNLVIIEQQNAHFLQLPKAKNFNKTLQNFRDSITQYAPSNLVTTTDNPLTAKHQLGKTYTKAAFKLYQQLIAPLVKKQLIHKQQSLTIIPHDALGYLPFDALLSKLPKHPERFNEHPYLLFDYTISYAYSASLLIEMCQQKIAATTKKQLLAFAPQFNTDNTYANARNINPILNHPLALNSLTKLLYNQKEVAAIAQQVPTKSFVGKQAIKHNFLTDAAQYRWLHIATHALANEEKPERSVIVFHNLNCTNTKTASIKNQTNSGNYLLYFGDIANLKLNAEMVVLSACETGLGKLQKGEGIISLTSAFAQAGAQSIVTTLWTVSDQVSSEIMESFYKNLKTGQNKSTAIATAKRNYIDNMPNLLAHPFFWASYLLIGATRPIIE